MGKTKSSFYLVIEPIINNKKVRRHGKLTGLPNIRGYMSFCGKIYTLNPYSSDIDDMEEWKRRRVAVHESVHYYQRKELTAPVFMLLYGLDFILGLIRYGHWKTAYRNILFEREAYEICNRIVYPKIELTINRNKFGWWDYRGKKWFKDKRVK